MANVSGLEIGSSRGKCTAVEPLDLVAAYQINLASSLRKATIRVLPFVPGCEGLPSLDSQ